MQEIAIIAEVTIEATVITPNLEKLLSIVLNVFIVFSIVICLLLYLLQSFLHLPP